MIREVQVIVRHRKREFCEICLAENPFRYDGGPKRDADGTQVKYGHCRKCGAEIRVYDVVE